ncbi:hypothetical protein [Campylobacter hyointestinalis]|uniref:hypothetical protein n=1 Tax=Campylobacter hyointestinalis TaxID=198 RepID=UPI0008188F5F|nr:hypothetical protein [Campylobacter hyointestinalis]OCS16468.1 hypothetical protein CfvWBT01109_02650 [Campylobacter fetus subsp. venerealis]RAZ45719.1 hypothetical protein CHL14416_07310 [Campylobacter hyointestinalis subsp. lawsonii]
MINLNNILNIKKQFKTILNYAKIFFSLLVGISLMSGCATHSSAKFENNGNQKWEDYFDSKEFKPINENKENLGLKQNLKKVM